MAERRCATPGCTGTLQPGTGTHCPRCGGTQFLPGRRRKAIPLALLLVVAAGAAVIVSFKVTKRSGLPSTGTLADRQPLIDAKEIADKMSITNSRDDAYSDIVHRALVKHDFEYACQVAEGIGVSVTRDKTLRQIVDDAIQQRQFPWAKRAAETMFISTERDKALRLVMDASHTGG